MIRIEPASMTDDIAAMLAPACSDLREVVAQVRRGVAKLFAAIRDGKTICAFVLRVDELATGPQGVIVAAAGHGGEINLTNALLSHIEGMFIDCDSVRIHTARPGLARRLSREFGYGLDELVLSKRLKK